MKILISLNVQADFVSKLAEEAECNSSLFVKNLCNEFLKKITKETKRITEETTKINKQNPYGFLK